MSKRFFLILFFGTIAGFIAVWATIQKSEGIAVVSVGIVGAIVAKYTHDETKRPSDKK